MSLFPVKSIQKCSNCKEDFMYVGNTLDAPIEVKCDDCRNPFFKGYRHNKWFDLNKN